MTLGDKVCYESYLGCGDQDMVYGHITKIYGDSFIITDIDGVEHTVYDKSRIFKVEKFPYRCKKFLDIYIYEDGTVLNSNGTRRYVRGEKSRGLYCKFDKINKSYSGINPSSFKKLNKSHTVARLVYKLFIDEDFDLDNQEYCITFKDGNFENTHWSNLEKVTRAELNRRIVAKNKTRG